MPLLHRGKNGEGVELAYTALTWKSIRKALRDVAEEGLSPYILAYLRWMIIVKAQQCDLNLVC
jgi:hypothetical protein